MLHAGSRNPADEPAGLAALYQTLALATPAERVLLVLACIERHPQGHLELGSVAGLHATLGEIDLSRTTLAEVCAHRVPLPAWWDTERGMLRLHGANLRGANLRGANLEGCDLQGADLRDALLGDARLDGANFEGANLTGADLAGATAQGAGLAGADLQEAMLEGTNLQGAVVRFANLRGAALEGALLHGADLWGATLDDATLEGADLRGAILREASLVGANLTGAKLTGVDAGNARLRRAVLRGADLQEAGLTGASLDDAVLQDARLQGLDLSSCTLSHVFLSGAWLAGVRLEQEQLEGNIGEEITRDYQAARKGYLGLEQCFALIGDPDAASWAYRKRRRMQKLESRTSARGALATHDLSAAAHHGLRYVTDVGAEWLCDYGESISRVLAAMVVVYIFFIVLYGLTGSVVRVGATPSSPTTPTSNLLDLAIFSLLAMTTSGSPVVGLLPHTEAVHLLTGLEALCGIFLTGLLGFVVGNRIRR